MLATAATAAGFHATPFLTAVYSSIVGVCVALAGLLVQHKRWKKEDAKNTQKDDYIALQRDTIIELHNRLEGERTMLGTDHNPQAPNTSA